MHYLSGQNEILLYCYRCCNHWWKCQSCLFDSTKSNDFTHFTIEDFTYFSCLVNDGIRKFKYIHQILVSLFLGSEGNHTLFFKDKLKCWRNIQRVFSTEVKNTEVPNGIAHRPLRPAQIICTDLSLITFYFSFLLSSFFD